MLGKTVNQSPADRVIMLIKRANGEIWGNKWGNMMPVVRRVEDGDRSPLML